MEASHHSSFEKCALASGLLTEQQLKVARAKLRDLAKVASEDAASADTKLANKLVEIGFLNVWQAQQLLQGRTKFTLGPYRIVDSLGQGGMGHVYRAEHHVLGRPVAIKVLPRDKTTPEAVASFTREIQAQASLNHPNLVHAIDAGHDGNVYYLVTEFVPGCDLRRLVRSVGPLEMETAASIIVQVAEGLKHAHQQGLIHRDVKPGNVLVTPEGEAKLSDLGLAGPMYAGVEEDPRYGKIVGTADYLSPDHILSPWNPTPGWDVYSLGCTLYYAVTGKVPFPGGTTSEKARAHCELRPLDPRRLNSCLGDAFVEVLADMMAKDPAQRIQSAAEVIERLDVWAKAASRPRWAIPSGPVPPPVSLPVRPVSLPVLPTTSAPMAAPPRFPPVAIASQATPPSIPAVQQLRDTVREVSRETATVGSPGLAGSEPTGRHVPTWLLVLAALAPIALAALAIWMRWRH